MVPEIDKLLEGISFTVREVIEPELTSSFARSQTNALLQVIKILRERVEKQQFVLLDESSALIDGLNDVLESLRSTEGNLSRYIDVELEQAIRNQLGQQYAEHKGQRSIAGLSQERLDLRALHVRIMRNLCQGPAFDDALCVTLRRRLRGIYQADFDLKQLFVSAWIE